jgi:tRNA-specific 2-thiouridylase
MKKKRVLLGLSWWVDSAVAGYLLLQQWYEVISGFMKNYTDENNPECTTRKDRDMAIKVSQHLWIKTFIIFDFRKEYNNKVVEYIFEWYKKWITPNPDILCNSEIKFKIFLEKALELNCDFIATWHYANIWNSDWEYQLIRWIDENKDQSYFLAWLNQIQLSKSLFPIWKYTKPEIRKLAEEINLPNANRKDSQWICFIWKVKMEDFLKQKIPIKKWNIINTKWEILWEHDWVFFHTIWQRKWLDIWWWPALYVVDKNIDKNELIVWEKENLNLFKNTLIATNWHWIWKEYTFPLKGKAQIRYRQEAQNITANKLDIDKIEIKFDKNIRAITSWQTIAVYIENNLVGNGIIK